MVPVRDYLVQNRECTLLHPPVLGSCQQVEQSRRPAGLDIAPKMDTAWRGVLLCYRRCFASSPADQPRHTGAVGLVSVGTIERCRVDGLRRHWGAWAPVPLDQVCIQRCRGFL